MKWKLNCLEATGVLNYIVNIFIIPQKKRKALLTDVTFIIRSIPSQTVNKKTPFIFCRKMHKTSEFQFLTMFAAWMNLVILVLA